MSQLHDDLHNTIDFLITIIDHEKKSPQSSPSSLHSSTSAQNSLGEQFIAHKPTQNKLAHSAKLIVRSTMNVTSHGYYTTQYLDQYRIKPRAYENSSSSRRQISNTNNAPLNPDNPQMVNTKVNPQVKSSDYLQVPLSSQHRQTKTNTAPTAMGTKSIASRANSEASGTSENSLNKTAPHTRPSSRNQSHPTYSSTASTPKSKSKAVFSPISKLTREIGRKDSVDLDFDDTVSNPDHLEQEITPAQLNIIQSRQRDTEIQRQLHKRKKYLAKNQHRSNQKPDIIHGKSMQMYLNKRDDAGQNEQYSSESDDTSGTDSDYSSFYYDYDNKKSSSPNSSNRAHLRNTHARQGKKYDYSDYYVLEKKKFDESPFKPKMYTHKTFKTVFQNKNENLDRYNPIDMVFQDSNDNDAKDQKLKSAFKNLQTKIGKSGYNDYDYYAQKKKDAEARAAKRQNARRHQKSQNAEVFATNASDDSEDEELFAGLPEETKNDMKNGKDYKRAWKKKLKVLKKELGQDYIKRYHENLTEKERLRRLSSNKTSEEGSVDASSTPSTRATQDSPSASHKPFSNKLEELDDDEEGTLSSDSENELQDKDKAAHGNNSLQKNYGPNPDFNPVWNYVLSWLVYEPPSPKNISVSNSYGHDTDYDSSEMSDVEDDTFQRRPEERSTSKSKPKKQSPLASKSSTKKSQKKKPGMKLNLDGIRKNYKSMVSTWHQPASALFTGDLAKLDESRQRELKAAAAALAASENPNTSSKYSAIRSLMSMKSGESANPSEIEIEVESDFDDVEELFYNPVTKGLDYNPPTSIDSMDVSASDSMTTASKLGSSSSMIPRAFKTPFFQSPSTVSNNAATPRAKDLLNNNTSPKEIISHVNSLIKSFPYMKIVFAPIDVIGENFPSLQTLILIIELVVFIWMFYEITKLINALCMAVQAVCAPMIALGRLMNRVM